MAQKQIDKDRISISASNSNSNINISYENKMIKLYISDYISHEEYIERMNLIDVLGVDHLISNFLLWNSNYQKINKGNYYIMKKDNMIYNVFINSEEVILDECHLSDDAKKEKIIKVELKSGEYSYTVFTHDKHGSTFIDKIFNSYDDSICDNALILEVALFISKVEDMMHLELINISKDNIKVKRLSNEK